MFWIAYSVTIVVASAIAIPLIAIRLVLSAVGRAIGSIPPLHLGTAASRWRVLSPQSHRWFQSFRKADWFAAVAVIKTPPKSRRPHVS